MKSKTCEWCGQRLSAQGLPQTGDRQRKLERLVLRMYNTIHSLGWGGFYARIDARLWAERYLKSLKRLGLK